MCGGESTFVCVDGSTELLSLVCGQSPTEFNCNEILIVDLRLLKDLQFIRPNSLTFYLNSITLSIALKPEEVLAHRNSLIHVIEQFA